MSDVFISHTHTDSKVAVDLAGGLEQFGYTTWYYERDSSPGESHLIQTSNAINECEAVLLIISRHSLLSVEVDRELERASQTGKHVIPVLTGIDWFAFEQFEGQKQDPNLHKQAQKWHMILGSVVGIQISHETFAETMNSLKRGLESLGHFPRDNAAAQAATGYPSPLAGIYASRLAGPIALQRAFQVHAGLRDAALSMAQLLAALVAADYRKNGSSARDADIEGFFAKLLEPGLNSWLSLLHAVLSQNPDTGVSVIREIKRFYYEKNRKNDAVSEAVLALRKWTGHAAGSPPPFSYQDFFELLSVYDSDKQGWLSPGAVLEPQQYQARSRLLRDALRQTLDDLRFLGEYVFIYAVDADGNEPRIFVGSGECMEPEQAHRNADVRLRPGHICLFGDYPDDQPLLDLYPLISARLCGVCNQVRAFWIRPGRSGGVDMHSYCCQHSMPPPVGYMEHFRAFLDSAEWERVSPPEKMMPLVNLLHEMIRDGELSEEERKQMDVLGRALHISPEDIAYWQDKILSEMKPLSQSLPPSTARETVLPKPVVAGQAGSGDRANFLATEEIMLQSAPILVAVSPEPRVVCIAGADGYVCLYDLRGRLLYREKFDPRPMRLMFHGKGFVVGCWDGRVSYMSRDQLEWQNELKGAVSALAGIGDDLLAGTWDGRIARLSITDGSLEWVQRMDDGISCLRTTRDGMYAAAGTYAGQITVLNDAGEVVWTRDTGTGIVDFAFIDRGSDLLCATADGQLSRIRIDGQELIWQEELPGIPKELALAGNTRRLYVLCADEKVRVYNPDHKLSAYEPVPIDGVLMYALLPFFPDGRFALALTRDKGLLSFNASTGEAVLEFNGNPVCTGVSADGRLVCVAGEGKATILHLAEPELQPSVEPVGALSCGRYTQLRVKVTNMGIQTARGGTVGLAGPFEFRLVKLPDELASGEQWIYDKQSVQPLKEGAISTIITVEYEDEYGIRYRREDTQVLTVEPGV